jgi:Chaperone of endosialidase
MKTWKIVGILLFCFTCSWTLAQSENSSDELDSQKGVSPLISISGTKGYVPLWLSSSSAGNSKIYQSTSGSTNGYIGIGTTDPVSAFEMNTAVPSSYDYLAYLYNSTNDINTIVSIGSPQGATNVGVDQVGGSYLYSSKGSIYLGPDETNTLWVGGFGCSNTCNGRVGMQTSTPQNPLDVAGAVAIGAYGGVDAAPSDGLIVSGNVGIGTPTPSFLLTLVQVGGPAYADSWLSYSSRRYKTNIQTLHGALEKLEQLRGVSYDLKANGKHEVGVIAEEVGAVVPEIVTWDKNGISAQGVDYGRLTALLIEATKEQQNLIDQQQEQIGAQQKQIDLLTSKIKTVETGLETTGEGQSTLRIVKASASQLKN